MEKDCKKDYKEIAQYVLRRLQKKADDAIVEAENINVMQVKFSNSKISCIQKWDTINLGIFASVNKRIVSTTLKDFSIESADKTVKNLLEFAKSIDPNKEYAGIAKGPFSYRKTENGFDNRIASMNEDAVVLAEEGMSIAETEGASRSAGVLETSNSNMFLCSSNDVEAMDRATSIYFSLRAFLDKDASGHKVGCSRMLSSLKLKAISKGAAEIALQAKNPMQGEAGNFDIVFSPLTYANLLDTAGSSASAFSVDAGLSYFAGKVGKKVANNAVTLYDDATLQNGYLSSPFDAEGAPTQKKPIIENGILKTYLHNTSTANKHKTKTTANAGLLSPEPFNLVLAPGKESEQGLIEGIKNGLLITNVWYTRFNNYLTGDFSTIPRDGIFSIKNGQIVNSLKNIRISDNMLNILANSVTAGKNLEQIHGWEVSGCVVTPSVCTKSVHITKPK